MIELIFNEEGEYTAEERALTEPKNIKQIGEPREFKKIFLEDYVHTFLQQYSEEKDSGTKVAVLLGKTERSGGKRYLYIKSALPVKNVLEKQGKYLFTEAVWGKIYQECELYFPNQEIIGWFLARPGFSVEKNSVIEETHRTYFSGAEKVLFMMEPLEKDSAFFAFDGNRFAKQNGYYIYYEKNKPMQGYMIEKNKMKEQRASNEKPDVVMANFRKILKEKQERNVKRKKQAISYGTKVAAALVVFVGVVAFRNQWEESYDSVPFAKKEVSGNLLIEASSEEVIVEELPGDVEEQLPVQTEIDSAAEEMNVVEEKVAVSEELSVEEIKEAPVYVQYIVQKGDTLAKISRDHYGTDEKVSEICVLNEIMDGDYIQAGEIILLP